MVLLLFIILLFFVQWLGNQGRIQKMGKLAKSYIEEEDKTEKIVLGENFVITQRELEYAIITENFKRDLRPEQHALDHLIRSKVVIVQAKKEGIVLTKKEKEQGKQNSPLGFLGVNEPYEIKQFFAAWESMEAGEEAMGRFIDESLLIRKYWNTKKQQFFSTEEGETEEELEDAWNIEKEKQIIQLIKEEKIINKSGVLSEKYGKYFYRGIINKE